MISGFWVRRIDSRRKFSEGGSPREAQQAHRLHAEDDKGLDVEFRQMKSHELEEGAGAESIAIQTAVLRIDWSRRLMAAAMLADG